MWTVKTPYAGDKSFIWNKKEGVKWRALWQDGKSHTSWDSTTPGQYGCFATRYEAQEFLNQWREENMNVDELKTKLEQAKKDRDSLDKNVKDLEKQIKDAQEYQPTHGDVLSFTDYCSSGTRLVIHDKYGDSDWIVVGASKNGTGCCHGLENIRGNFRAGYYKLLGNIFDGYKL